MKDPTPINLYVNSIFLLLIIDFISDKKTQQDCALILCYVYSIRKISEFISQVDSKQLYAQICM